MVDAKPWVAPVDNGDQAESRFAGFCKMLGAVRINAMVESLQLSQQIRENIYQLNLTFTKILNNYREQTQCEPQFFCVFVDWSSARCRGACEQRTGQEHVGIITFYNEIFFPSVESLLFELGRPGGATVKSDQIPEVSIKNDGHLAQCPGYPKTPPIPSQKKVSATQSVDVSPIRSSVISRLKLTFRKIVYQYRKQPQCDPQVFLSVFIDWSLACKNGACKQRTGQEDVNIITFYNEIFIPSVKPLLFEL